MGPKGKHPATGDLFQQTLAELINLKHPLGGILSIEAPHVVLCGAGHNLRVILRALRLFCACIADRNPWPSPKPRFGRLATA